MDDTSTGKFDDIILEIFSRDQLFKTSKHPNTTSSLVGDPNFVYPIQVKALLDNSVISQIETSKVETTSPIGSNRIMANGRKISPKKEYWDTSVSAHKNPPFRNPTHTKKNKEESAARTIFCSKCKAKHLRQECPFNLHMSYLYKTSSFTSRDQAEPC